MKNINNEANARKLANQFNDLLKAEMTADEYAEMIKLNAAETNANICHSHDFVDANAAMADAFAISFIEEIDFEAAGYLNLINAAWLIFKKELAV